MEDKLLELEEISERFDSIGKQLFSACNGKLFPADALFLASCNRALQVLNSFVLLMRNNSYSCSMALLRLQLDSVLRLYGITKTNDVHASANEVIQGKKLSSIKDKAGKKLHDGHLVDLFSELNPWVKHVYKTCSGYIHLSDASFYHLMLKSESIPNSTEKMFYIGPDESEIEEKHKLELVQAFKALTIGIQDLTIEWAAKRHMFGSTKKMKILYQSSA